jgi:hypothetical protein
MIIHQPEQSVGCRFWDDEKQACRALTELVCADRRCSMRLTEEEHAESCKRAAERCKQMGIKLRQS